MRREGCSVPSVASLEAALHSTDPRYRFQAALALGMRGDKRAVSKLKVVQERDPDAKETARLGSPELVQFLDSGPDLDLQAGRDPWQVDSSEPNLAQPLRARPADIEGRWKASVTSAPSAVIRRIDDNLYELEIQTGGCLGDWKLQRKVRYESGVLTLDFPAMEYPTKRFQRLFIIEISGEQFLLPSADVDRYLRCLRGRARIAFAR
jgi:hypothetical protein